MFFFEKKNQKTFANFAAQRSRMGVGAGRDGQKFFASFFQKRSPSFRVAVESTD
jgi:hypothetical protein